MIQPLARARSRLVIGALLAASGCALLAPRPDPTRFYLLTPVAEEAVRESASPGPVALGIGPIGLPEYLDRPEVVVRTGANRIALSPIDRWAEPLKSGFARVLADNVGRLLGTERILMFPWYRDARIDYQVHAAVQRFETDEQGNAVLVVRWGIKSRDGKEYLRVRESRYEAKGQDTDPGADAGALSEALARFSRDVAAAIEEVRRGR